MEDNIFISQSKYAESIVNKFGLEKASSKRTHAATHVKLTKDENGFHVDQSLYRSLIDSLLYLKASICDITSLVGVCAICQAKPKANHITRGKRIVKYISGTYDHDILYYHDINSILLRYCDVDWLGNIDDRKSTFGGCFFLGNNLISWFNKKHNCHSLSIAEVQYIVAGTSCTQLLWMKYMLKEYNVEQES